MSAKPLLEIDDLSVELPTERGPLRAVCGVSLSVEPSRSLGIVGESGSGKTMLARAILQLLPGNARVTGTVSFDDRNLFKLSGDALRRLRGREVAVVFQDPMTSLNPVLTVGSQIVEVLREHLGLSRRQAMARAIALLAEVGIPEPEQRAFQYPHQLSGGMRQRIAIAIAISCEPRLLIADEPTTALDVTVQAQILDLLARERAARHMAMVLITHDLGVVAGRTDEVAVMYAGRIVERAPTRKLFKNTCIVRTPKHYWRRSRNWTRSRTRALLQLQACHLIRLALLRAVRLSRDAATHGSVVVSKPRDSPGRSRCINTLAGSPSALRASKANGWRRAGAPSIRANVAHGRASRR
jgi:peptide/nickel transport system ATP-binding protein